MHIRTVAALASVASLIAAGPALADSADHHHWSTDCVKHQRVQDWGDCVNHQGDDGDHHSDHGDHHSDHGEHRGDHVTITPTMATTTAIADTAATTAER